MIYLLVIYITSVFGACFYMFMGKSGIVENYAKEKGYIPKNTIVNIALIFMSGLPVINTLVFMGYLLRSGYE